MTVVDQLSDGFECTSPLNEGPNYCPAAHEFGGNRGNRVRITARQRRKTGRSPLPPPAEGFLTFCGQRRHRPELSMARRLHRCCLIFLPAGSGSLRHPVWDQTHSNACRMWWALLMLACLVGPSWRWGPCGTWVQGEAVGPSVVNRVSACLISFQKYCCLLSFQKYCFVCSWAPIFRSPFHPTQSQIRGGRQSQIRGGRPKGFAGGVPKENAGIADKRAVVGGADKDFVVSKIG